MPRDYSKPYKHVGDVERVYAPTGTLCDAHALPEPCQFCISNRERELFAEQLLAREEEESDVQYRSNGLEARATD